MLAPAPPLPAPKVLATGYADGLRNVAGSLTKIDASAFAYKLT